MKKKLLGLFLLLCLLMMGTTAFEARAEEEERIHAEITHINPLYADVISEADLWTVPPVYYSTGSVEYHETIEDAAEVLREQIKERASTIVIGIQYPDSSDLSYTMFSEAVAHTGDPIEGDYLMFTYGGYQCSMEGYRKGTVWYMAYTYNMSYYTTAAQEAELDAAVDELLVDLNLENASDYEKVCGIYDYICENITYDYENLNKNYYLLKYTAYAALVDGTAVCQGYANLFYRLALELDVDARIIAGDAGGPHAWNIVKLGNVYYNLDSTWDASYWEAGLDYRYFLQNPEGFSDHYRDATYETEEFHAAYPMSAYDYDDRPEEEPDVTPTVTPTPTPAGVAISEENFPDDIFRQYVSDNYDLTNDGMLSEAEANIVSTINVEGMGIQSLEGLEYFPNLLNLLCKSNDKLTSLDVSHNPKLGTLWCEWSPVGSLDLSNNPELVYLYCAMCELTELDVSNNPYLSWLYCDQNELTELDLSNNPNLVRLMCNMNKLTELDLSNNPYISYLLCNNNELTALDVSNQPCLDTLWCHCNQLTSLDLSNNRMLTVLWCSNNTLNQLDVSMLTELIELECIDTKLTEIDLSNNARLQILRCASNPIEDLDVKNCVKLEILQVNECLLAELDISNNKELVTLSCGLNKFTELDVSNNTKLQNLSCEHNCLTEIDVSNNTELTNLWCYGNNLAGLDLDNNTKLEELQLWSDIDFCPEMKLSSLPAFNLERISNWDGASYDAEADILVLPDGGGLVSYTYDCGNGYTITVKLYVGHMDQNDDYLCDFCKLLMGVPLPELQTPAKPYKITNVVSGVHVYWNAVDGVSQYGVWRSANGKDGDYVWLGNPKVPHFTDTKAVSGTTYYYKVTAYDATTKTHSDMSEPIGIIYVSTPDITVRENTTDGMLLGWEKITGATGYAIYRKPYSGNEAWDRVGTIEGNSTFEWTDTSVVSDDGTAYKYTIRALAGSNRKTLSGCRNAGRTVVRLTDCELLDAYRLDDTTMECYWIGTEGAEGYEILLTAANGTTRTVTVAGGDVDTYTISKLTAGTNYSVQMRAYKKLAGVGTFYSGWTEKMVVSGGEPIELIVPAKPYKIANVVSGVHVYWRAAGEAVKYGVWRSATGKNGNYEWLGNPEAVHFTDVEVESGTTYFYKITSYDPVTGEHSAMSEPIGIVYVSTPDIITRVNTAEGVALGWEEIFGAEGYAIYRKSYSGTDDWVRIATIRDNTTLEWTDTSVAAKNGEEYKYTIRALAGSNLATLSGCRGAGRSMVRLTSVALKSAEATGANSVKCSWGTTAKADGYEVRFLENGVEVKKFTVSGYKIGTKTFTGLDAGTSYEVQVRTYKKLNGVGTFYSGWSEAGFVTTK